MIEINLTNCSRDPNTCSVVQHLIELDEVAASVEDIDPNVAVERELFGNYVTACVNGNCPGMNLEKARQCMQDIIARDT